MARTLADLEITSRAAWRAWLETNHATSPGVWVVTWKKASGGPYVAYDDIVEEALCFGWIDSTRRTVDADRSRIMVVPRRPGSGWSRLNRARVERLRAAGRMAPAGLAAVERARADGSWTAQEPFEALIEPDDLRAALDADPEARRNWDAFPPSARRVALHWIGTAKRPATRATRIERTVESARRNERP